MTYAITRIEYNTQARRRTISRLNKNRIGDPGRTKQIKAMGLAACQGLCITYNLHSKRFCK